MNRFFPVQNKPAAARDSTFSLKPLAAIALRTKRGKTVARATPGKENEKPNFCVLGSCADKIILQ